MENSATIIGFCYLLLFFSGLLDGWTDFLVPFRYIQKRKGNPYILTYWIDYFMVLILGPLHDFTQQNHRCPGLMAKILGVTGRYPQSCACKKGYNNTSLESPNRLDPIDHVDRYHPSHAFIIIN